MEFSIKLHTIKSGWPFVYFEGSQPHRSLPKIAQKKSMHSHLESGGHSGIWKLPLTFEV